MATIAECTMDYVYIVLCYELVVLVVFVGGAKYAELISCNLEK